MLEEEQLTARRGKGVILGGNINGDLNLEREREEEEERGERRGLEEERGRVAAEE